MWFSDFQCTIVIGEIIELISKIDESWWEGRIYNTDVRGWFPFNYVRSLKPKEIEKLEKVEKRKTPPEANPAVDENKTNDKDWRLEVFTEILKQSTLFITEIKEVLETCQNIQKAAESSSVFAVSRLETSADMVHKIEQKLEKLFQAEIDINSFKVGNILLEVNKYNYIVNI